MSCQKAPRKDGGVKESVARTKKQKLKIPEWGRDKEAGRAGEGGAENPRGGQGKGGGSSSSAGARKGEVRGGLATAQKPLKGRV